MITCNVIVVVSHLLVDTLLKGQGEGVGVGEEV